MTVYYSVEDVYFLYIVYSCTSRCFVILHRQYWTLCNLSEDLEHGHECEGEGGEVLQENVALVLQVAEQLNSN